MSRSGEIQVGRHQCCASQSPPARCSSRRCSRRPVRCRACHWPLGFTGLIAGMLLGLTLLMLIVGLTTCLLARAAATRTQSLPKRLPKQRTGSSGRTGMPTTLK